MESETFLVKAFTQDSNVGNPAGVVVDADDLSEDDKKKIAAQLGFSETAFVSKSDSADFKVEFFSPQKQVPLCGHATIATFHILMKLNRMDISSEFQVVTQETLAGVLPVECHADGRIVMAQSEPVFYDQTFDRKSIASLLNISEVDIRDMPIELISTGVPKLIIPVASLEVLFSIQPDLKGMKEFSKKSNVRGFYPYTTETKDTDSDFHARQF